MSLEVGALFVKLELDTSAFERQFEKIQKDIASKTKFSATLDLLVNSSSIAAAQSSIQSLNKDVDNSKSHFSSLGDTIRNAFSFAIGSILADGIRFIGNALKGSTSAATDFEHQMSALKAVLSPTGDELEALRQKALQLGKDTAFSANESASAMEELAKQGASVSDIINGAADATVTLASAAGTDLVTAATVTTDAMNSFGLTTDQLGHAVDGVTGAVNESKFGIEDYQLALAQGGAVVHSLGMSFDDFNTIFAATASQFHSGEQAGTALRNFIINLTPSTDKARDAMRDLGLITADGTNKFYNANGTLKNAAEIADLVAKSFGNLTDEQKSAYIEAIFGAKSLGVVNGLLQQGKKGVEEYAAAIGNTSAADEAATRLDNFDGVVKQIQGSWDAFVITISQGVLPIVTSLAKELLNIINVATTVAEAIFGSQEAFNSLPPALQEVVVFIQEFTSYFSELANAAFSWGSNIAAEFGSGLLSAASEVVSALQEMGSWVTEWLAPGSPPKIVPQLDQYGKDAATVYWDSWAKGDYSALKDMGNTVTDVLTNLVDTGSLAQTDVIPTVIGTREQFSAAITELNKLGSVSETTIQRVLDSTGAAKGSVESLVRSYFNLQTESKKTALAEKVLYDAQTKLNSVMSAYKAATDPINKALDDLRKKQDALDLQEQIKQQTELANAIGGDGTTQEKARLKLQELVLKQQLAAKDEEYSGIISNAQAEQDAAQKALDEQKAKEDAAKAQYELEQQKLDVTKENNDLIKQQIELMKQLADEQAKALEESTKKSTTKTKKAKKDTTAEKEAKAQEEYNLSLLDTQGKINYLKNKLGSLKEGSVEYYQTLEDIKKLEDKKAKDEEKDAKKAETENDKRLKAEESYKLSLLDTAGKIDYYKKKLAGLEVGSEEYYKTLEEIQKLEDQQSKEKKKKDKGGGLGVPKPGTQKIPEIKKPEPKANPLADTVNNASEQIGKFKAGMDQAKASVETFLAPLKSVVDFIQANFIPILAGVATPVVLGLATAIGATLVSAFAFLLSPIALITGAVVLFALAWQNNFGNIQTYTTTAITYIQSAISQFLSVIQDFWSKHGQEVTATVSVIWERISTIIGTFIQLVFATTKAIFGGMADFIKNNHDRIVTVIMAAWNLISGFIQGILGVIQQILNFWLAVVQGKWKDAWEAIKNLLIAAWNLIYTTIVNFLNLVASFFGTSLDGLVKLWSSNWDKIKSYLFSILLQIITYLIGKIADIIKMWTDFTDSVKKLWSDVWDAINTKISTIIGIIITFINSKVAEFKAAFQSIIDGIIGVWDNLFGDSDNSLYHRTLNAIADIKEMIYNQVEYFIDAAKAVGGAIVQGMIQGIGDSKAVSELIEKAKALARRAVQAVRDILDSHSPSRVFEDIGQSAPQGMVLGIEKGIPDVAAAVNSMATNAITTPTIPSMATTGTNINNYFNIDARGSTLSENDFRKIVIDVTDQQARRAVNRR